MKLQSKQNIQSNQPNIKSKKKTKKNIQSKKRTQKYHVASITSLHFFLKKLNLTKSEK
jgi:glycosylphosphatidylinositol transamidase (GPIT) subunit GPI8